MRYRPRTLAVALALGVPFVAACAGDEVSESCDKSEAVEDAMSDLDELAEQDTSALNIDEKLEQLGEDVNDVMNTTDDENALQISELDLHFEDLRGALEDLGNADDFSESGDAMSDGVDQLADAVHEMSAATEEECTP